MRVVHEQLDALKNLKGSIVSTKQFLSTSEFKDVALKYACPFDQQDPNSQPLLLEICVDLSSPEIIAAKVDELAAIPDENEILFKFGNKFQVDEFKYDNSSGVWLCKLRATREKPAFIEPSESMLFSDFLAKLDLHHGIKDSCTTNTMEQDHTCQSYVDNSESPLNHSKKTLPWLSSTSIEWANILHLEFLIKWQEIGTDIFSTEWEHALQTYINWLNYVKWDIKMLSNDLNFAYILNNLGFIHLERGKNQQAASLIRISLDMRKRLLPPNHLLLAQSYRNLGLIYANLKEFQVALHWHERALDITEQASTSVHWATVLTLKNMGDIHQQSHNYSQAAMYYSKALIAYHSCMHAFIDNTQ
ncbi:unnamed protein product [Rotaria magnacalcarata]|uniref:Tetratricopeptide repeat protein n=2 Tax=Rotaria magnacalcarata TaxID=392030 RepID=A0A820FH32_9BILA|nr:unnamed protein product [Rotaria magnacalcarata]